jgi:uncharacterized membrane protein YphA (DoxX/SURF4 family)
MPKLTRDDLFEFLFRALFCGIFLALGWEHLFSDNLIQRLMPAWLEPKRAASILAGLWLSVGGVLLFLGYRLRFAAVWLGIFLVVVTVGVHLPGIVQGNSAIPAEMEWMWQILQRTNLAKNICLLGVCFHLWSHQPGRLSLTEVLRVRSAG